MIEQWIVHLPHTVKDIDQPVSIYLVHLSRVVFCTIRDADTARIMNEPPIRSQKVRIIFGERPL
jgi:hypothetical protein